MEVCSDTGPVENRGHWPWAPPLGTPAFPTQSPCRGGASVRLLGTSGSFAPEEAGTAESAAVSPISGPPSTCHRNWLRGPSSFACHLASPLGWPHESHLLSLRHRIGQEDRRCVRTSVRECLFLGAVGTQYSPNKSESLAAFLITIIHPTSSEAMTVPRGDASS